MKNNDNINNIKSINDDSDIFLFGIDSDEIEIDNFLLAKGDSWICCVYGITIYGIGL